MKEKGPWDKTRQRQYETVSCVSCGAAEGSSCRTKKGIETFPHRDRVNAVLALSRNKR